MDGQRIADRGLDQETVEDRSVVSVVIESVDEPWVEFGLVGLRAPYDSLVEIGDTHTVVVRVELEQQLIQRFTQVVHAAGLCG